MRRALVLVLLALPSLAAARPITAGVDLGLSHSEYNSNTDTDASSTLGVFARVGLTSRLAAQLEVQRVRMDDTYGASADLKTGTALLVVELGATGRLVPTLKVGVGLDRASDDYGYGATTGHHIEGGFGLEYRLDGGLTLGADVRMGGRSIDDEQQYAYEDAVPGTIALYAPSALQAGEYRSARLTLGVRF
jgi:hypothetical protein